MSETNKNFDEVVRKLKSLKGSEQRRPLYNLIGSEGDWNTRIIVDDFLFELKESSPNRH